jgi:phosphoglycerate dehydrogenase-like enzyme
MSEPPAPVTGERHRVAVLDDYQGVALGMTNWASLGDAVDVMAFRDHVDDPDELVRRLEPFDIIAAMRERTPFPRSLLERLPNLRLLVTSGPKNDAIDIDAARELGVVVSGTVGRNGIPGTVELTWALILAAARSLHREDALVRAGGWQGGLGTVLHGKTLGIVGLGNIGPRMIPVAQAFGMNVTGWSRNLSTERAAELGVQALSREEFFSTADVITVHLKLSSRSVGYVGGEELSLMKPTAVLVNTSRGPLIDEAALIEALGNGTIAAAGLDVYNIEPLPAGHPFRTLENLVLSPHMGYVTQETYADYFGGYLEDIEAFLQGNPIRVLTDGADLLGEVL